MKKIYYILTIILFLITLPAQRIVLVGNPEVGNPENEKFLKDLIPELNGFDSLDAVIFIGNLTSDGSTANLEKIKILSDNLIAKVFFVSGRNDLRWSDSGGQSIYNTFSDDKFSFTINNFTFVGLNTNVLFNETNPHIKPEDLDWLNDELDSKKNNNFILITSSPLNETTDNTDDLWNLENSSKIKLLINSAVQSPKQENIKKNFLSVTNFVNPLTRNFDCFLLEIKNDTAIVSKPLSGDSVKVNISLISAQSKAGNVVKNLNPVKDAKIIWERNLAETTFSDAVVYKNKIINTAYNGNITCLDSAGTILWLYETNEKIAGKAVVIDDIMAAGTLSGSLIALDINTGQQIASIGFEEPIVSPVISFSYTGTKQLMTNDYDSLMSAVVFSTSSGKVYCYHLKSLEQLWVNESPKSYISMTGTTDGYRTFFNCWDGFTYCIDNRNGTLIWRWSMDKNILNSTAGSPIVFDGTKIYFVSKDGFVNAIDKKLGSLVWRENQYKAFESIGISKNKEQLYVKGSQERFHIVSSKTGKWLKEIKNKSVFDKSRSVIYEVDNRVLFGTNSGNIYMLNNKNILSNYLKVGKTTINSVQYLGNNRWISNDIDGKITCFEVK